jgi:hypothetical protein
MLKDEIIGKAAFPIYIDYWDKYFSKLSGEQIKEILKIVFHFNKTFEILQTSDLAVEMVVTTIIDSVKRDAEKRSKQSRANRENGQLGGRPSKTPTKTKDIHKPKATRKHKGATIVPDFIKTELWNGFVEMRTKAKKPLTKVATDLIIKSLTIYEDSKPGDANIALENSIKSGWQGVFKPNEPRIYLQKDKSSGIEDLYQSLKKDW